jgi:PAS domain S-box-containing protein
MTALPAILTSWLDTNKSYEYWYNILPVGIFLTDVAGDIVDVNDRWWEMAGLTREQARSASWVRALHPEDRDRVVVQWRQAVATRSPLSLEYRWQRPNGAITWVYSQSLPERGDLGRTIGYVGTTTDITERKRTENMLYEKKERYRVILAAMADAVITTDPSA